MKTILVISNLDDIYRIIYKEREAGKIARLEQYRVNEIAEIKESDYDVVIVNYSKEMLENDEFKLIFDLKVKINAPILAILEGGSTREKLNLIRFGIEDYIDKPLQREELLVKIESLARYKRVMEKIKNG